MPTLQFMFTSLTWFTFMGLFRYSSNESILAFVSFLGTCPWVFLQVYFRKMLHIIRGHGSTHFILLPKTFRKLKGRNISNSCKPYWESTWPHGCSACLFPLCEPHFCIECNVRLFLGGWEGVCVGRGRGSRNYWWNLLVPVMSMGVWNWFPQVGNFALYRLGRCLSQF